MLPGISRWGVRAASVCGFILPYTTVQTAIAYIFTLLEFIARAGTVYISLKMRISKVSILRYNYILGAT
jgi:hypothetical protein